MRNVFIFLVCLSFYFSSFSQEVKTRYQKESLILKGHEFYKSKEFIPALDTYTEALRYYHSIKDDIKIQQTSTKIGDIYSILNNYESALKHHLTALKIANKINDIDGQINSYIKIGNTYFIMELKEEGLKNINTAFEIFNTYKSKDSLLLAKLFLEQGKIYGSLGQYELALHDYKKAIPIFKKDNNSNSLATIYNNLGVDLKEQGLYEDALTNFKLAKDYWKSPENDYKRAICDLNIALVLSEQKKIDSSFYYTEKALLRFKELKRSYFIKDCYENLSKLEGLKSNYVKSLEYLKMHLKLKDSILNASKMQKSFQQYSNYQINIVEEKNNLQMKISNERNRSKIQFWSMLSLLLALTLFILSMILKRNKERKELAELNLKNVELKQTVLTQEINLKNNKLSQLSGHILNKNEMLQQLKKYVQLIKKEHDIDVSVFMNKINQQINIETERKEFELFIDEKHTEFFFKIKQKYPDFTEKELKLCSLLLLELSSKEIATLLNISSSSVDMSRYRLRKKLNIPSKKNISTFLSEL